MFFYQKNSGKDWKKSSMKQSKKNCVSDISVYFLSKKSKGDRFVSAKLETTHIILIGKNKNKNQTISLKHNEISGKYNSEYD